MHIGRSFVGTLLEDHCPCIKAECGLVKEVNESCDEHSLSAAKTIRQTHLEEHCPKEKM